jgi:hypothetical protein
MKKSIGREPIPFKHSIFPAVGRGLLLIALLAGCGAAQMTSRPKDTTIVIDGKLAEWGGKMEYIEKAGFSVGLVNDDLYMYVAFAIRDPRLSHRLMRTGLTLWLNDRGNKDKSVGIQFPDQTANLDISTEMEEGRPPQGSRAKDEGQPPRGHRGEMAPDTSMVREIIRNSIEEMVILFPKNLQFNELPVSSVGGVEAMVAYDHNVLAYEFKVPLVAGQMTPVAIGSKRVETIGLGLESPELSMTGPGEEMGGGRMGGGGPGGGRPPGGMPGGMGEGGGGRPPGGMGGSPGQRPEMPKPLDLWAVVQLARTNQVVH